MQRKEEDIHPGPAFRHNDMPPVPVWHLMADQQTEEGKNAISRWREDSDNLLVFAGLYSAVLSAFNVQSYLFLVPDPNSQIIALLEQIVMQTKSYTVISGTINSTTESSFHPPGFSAPLWAVRVNALWFSSLIISLAAASSSIIVGQWLREFAAITYRTPQQRVRAHMYRRASLADWKVFEIAAILPMLLQLSLGLFFIGLCIFTVNIDERMGLTTIPLVSGWGFFLASTTLAPLFSPRCPYKLPLFRSIMRYIRIRFTTRLISWYWALRAILGGNMFDVYPQEEEYQVSAEQDDFDLLLTMDFVIADDDLLPTMWETVKYYSEPDKGFRFLVELLIRRMGHSSSSEYLRQRRLRCIPDLTLLAPRTWCLFMTMFADLINQGHSTGPLRDSSPDWHYNATLLLMSYYHHPLPSYSAECLQNLFADTPESTAARSLASWIHSYDCEFPFKFHPLAKRLGSLYESVKGKQTSALAPLLMYAALLQELALQPVLDRENYTIYSTSIMLPKPLNTSAEIVAEDMLQFMCKICDKDIPGADDAFATLISFSSTVQERFHAASALMSAWISSQQSYWALGHVARLVRHRGETPHSYAMTINLAVDAFMRSTDRSILIIRSTQAALRITEGKPNDSSISMDVVRFCSLHVQLYRQIHEHMQHSTSQAGVARPIPWSELWDAISTALQSYWSGESWTQPINASFIRGLELVPAEGLLAEDRRLAAECLHIMDLLEYGTATSDPAGLPKEIIFPDTLIAALGLFIIPHDVPRHRRLLQLQEKKQNMLPGLDFTHQTPDTASSCPSSVDTDVREALQEAMFKKALREVASKLGIRTTREGTRPSTRAQPRTNAGEVEEDRAKPFPSDTASIHNSASSATRSRLLKRALRKAASELGIRTRRGSGESETNDSNTARRMTTAGSINDATEPHQATTEPLELETQQ